MKTVFLAVGDAWPTGDVIVVEERPRDYDKLYEFSVIQPNLLRPVPQDTVKLAEGHSTGRWLADFDRLIACPYRVFTEAVA